MKVLASYSPHDVSYVEALAEQLRAGGIQVWLDRNEIAAGTSFIEKTRAAIEATDAVLAIVSANFVASAWAQEEIATWRLHQINRGKPRIIAAVVHDVDVPSSLADYPTVDVRAMLPADAAAAIMERLRWTQEEFTGERERPTRMTEDRTDWPAHIERLRTEFQIGNLTLFCGAGVSIKAGIPSWSDLVKKLITDLFVAGEPDPLSQTDTNLLADVYQNAFGLSPLIIAQYLKNGLGRDFARRVRQALYAAKPATAEIINAIIDLCRPQRDRQSLRAIITFNFDDLIERSLEKARIKSYVICAEGQRPRPSELPIYHVHGFLPRRGKQKHVTDLVFSEDAYHSQFIDPFSWSNLTQLHHLGQNTCLLVGLSLTDPNLRRLLDVSMRKNPDKASNHYIIRRRHDEAELARHLGRGGFKAAEQTEARKLIRMAEILEEKDANNLGLNIIWITDFDEIPVLLKTIAAD